MRVIINSMKSTIFVKIASIIVIIASALEIFLAYLMFAFSSAVRGSNDINCTTLCPIDPTDGFITIALLILATAGILGAIGMWKGKRWGKVIALVSIIVVIAMSILMVMIGGGPGGLEIGYCLLIISPWIIPLALVVISFWSKPRDVSPYQA